MVVILGSSVLLGAVEVRGLLGISLSASGSHGVGLLQSHLHFSSPLYDKHRRSRPLSLAHTQMVFFGFVLFLIVTEDNQRTGIPPKKQDLLQNRPVIDKQLHVVKPLEFKLEVCASTITCLI